MPPAIPLVAAAAGYAASAGIAAAVGATLGTFSLGAIGAAMGGFLVATAVNAVGSRAFSSKPSRPDFTQSASNQAVMVRTSVESHKVVYGRAKVSGPVVFIGTTNGGPKAEGGTISGTNLMLHVVVALAGHEVDAIDTVYLNDVPVTLDASGWVTSAPYVYQTPVPVPSQPIQNAQRYQGVVTITTATAHGFTLGQRVLIAGVGDQSMNGSFTIAAVPTTTSFRYRKNGPDITASLSGAVSPVDAGGPTASYVRIKKFTGSPDQAASPDMTAEIPGWDASHRLRGVAYLYVRMEFSQERFPAGIPNISAVVQGKRIYDPRVDRTIWSDNPALCIRDYLLNDYGFACGADEINDEYFSAAANVCDESVPLSTSGAQARYTSNGVLDTASAPLDNLNALVASMAGTVTYVQGRFRAHAGAYDAPAGDIDPSMLAGPVKIRTRPSRQETFNAVQGTYVDPALNWQPTDFPPVTNPAYEAADGGQRLSKDVQLPFTNHPEAAQRIAKVILEQGRQGIQVELTLNHAALAYAAWDTVTYTDPTLGWDRKVFRIKGLSTPGVGPVTLSLQEESSAGYDWNRGEAATADAAPDTNLPDPLLVQPPKALAVVESKYVTRDGAGVKALVTMAWLASNDAFVAQYQPEYKVKSEAGWKVLPRTPDASADIHDIAPDTYDFRVKAISTLGVSSAYATTSQQISGLLDAPARLQNLTISTIGGLAILRWDQSTDVDVRIGGKIVFRHSPDEAAAWTQTTTIGNAVPGAATVAVLPLKPGVYLAKAVDSSGIEAADAAGVVTEQATALAFANITSLTEDPTFSGTKTDCSVSGGVLKIDAAGIFDDIPDFDAAPNLDAYGGVLPSATYHFSGGIDLGSVQNVRITTRLKAQVANEFDLIDDRSADIDDWTSFDGDAAADADAVVYARQTNDDPGGTPAWKDWNRLDSAEFSARAFEFKVEMTSIDPAYNIQISELSATVDQVS
jgi:hypothetical protein